ncbi:hypothetical protein SAMN04489712_1434 [Thermomonospora echinospora]|uniref:Mobilisation protein (MobC) n=1 Tax=Thermomonospora echinospora TaxID=1992 RepID=A0A1H6EAX7_9ACTN|nr:hypothetical protein [Thermomonospora echinospora]SEG94076.1 hypothetical protein SAMN04489712_1434 [Thermomonospora echinospora]
MTAKHNGMGRQGHRRRRQKEPRSRGVRVPFTEAEYAAVCAAAERQQMAVAAYAGQVLVAVAEGADPPQWTPLRELMGQVIRAAEQVRRIGNNLNQAVAALHALGRPTGALEGYARVASAAVENLDELAEEIRRRLP